MPLAAVPSLAVLAVKFRHDQTPSLGARASLVSALTKRAAEIASFVRAPWRYLPLRLPAGAPPRAPCIRQTFQPFTAGDRQGKPVRLDFAEQRGAACALCIGLTLIL